jgi:hypothetical protein
VLTLPHEIGAGEARRLRPVPDDQGRLSQPQGERHGHVPGGGPRPGGAERLRGETRRWRTRCMRREGKLVYSKLEAQASDKIFPN